MPGSHGYTVTSYGLRVALFYTKVYLRVLRPAWAALTERPDLPRHLRQAPHRVEPAISHFCDDAKLSSHTGPPTVSRKLESLVTIPAPSGV